MPKLIAAAMLLVVGLPTTALAEPPPLAPVAEPDPPGAQVAHAQCIPIAGNPALEEAALETTDPDGHPIPQLCPPGQVLVFKGTSRLRKDRAPMRRARRHAHRHARHRT